MRLGAASEGMQRLCDWRGSALPVRPTAWTKQNPPCTARCSQPTQLAPPIQIGGSFSMRTCDWMEMDLSPSLLSSMIRIKGHVLHITHFISLLREIIH